MNEPTLADLMMAMRYAYYVESNPLMQDTDYDTVERFADMTISFHERFGLGSDQASSYTPEQKALAAALRKGALFRQ